MNPDNTILPAIVKPSGGSASQGISIINELTELEGLNEDDIIQPYLFPEESDKNYRSIYNAVKNGKFLQMSEISIQLIFNKNSVFSGIFISKNTLKNGVPVYVDPINPKSFEYTDEILKFVPILESRGVRGPVNIQGRITPKGLYFFEMNMRFTGITGNRAQLGFNEVDFLTRNFLGLECHLNEYAFNKVGVRQVACTTIERQYERKEKETLTVFGGGSNVGRIFIQQTSGRFKKINVIVRAESWDKYEHYFDEISNVHLVKDSDVALEEILCQSDVLINFISALAFEDEVKKYDAIRYIQRMIVKIAKANINKVINISSQSVYPQSVNVSKKEEQRVEYKGSYAFQKVIMEDMFASIKEFRPLTKVVSLRLTRVIAPSIPGQSGFFGKMIKAYKDGEKINIPYAANNTNLIHVNDVVSAIRFVLTEMDNKDLPNVLNVGGENISIEEYVTSVKNLVEGTGSFVVEDNDNIQNSSMVDQHVLEELGWSYNYKMVDLIQELSK
jgi:nucleoside-diphosphate-sugar epimerase